jgi:hypothetical protein
MLKVKIKATAKDAKKLLKGIHGLVKPGKTAVK